MMEAVIHISSQMDYGMEEEDTIDFTTDGFYTFENGIAKLAYFESEVTGLSGTHTSVVISPLGVIVDRKGTLTSRMEFRPGEKKSFLYDTPVGSATMNMNTRSIRHSFGPQGGSLEIDYVLDMEHTVVSSNKFTLSVREQ